MASLPQNRSVTNEAGTAMPQMDDAIGDAELGVPEAWVVSPEVYLEEGGWARAGILAGGDQLKPKPFPNVLIDIASIWPD